MTTLTTPISTATPAVASAAQSQLHLLRQVVRHGASLTRTDGAWRLSGSHPAVTSDPVCDDDVRALCAANLLLIDVSAAGLTAFASAAGRRAAEHGKVTL